jgi:putative IMPACT (imprinted ancient) family translation regulator
VVTRWYGGIKLGAGGLVRAYGGSVAECLRLAPRRTLVRWCELDLAYPFDATGAVHAAMAQFGAQKLDETFGADGVHLRLQLPADRRDALKTQLRDATRDRVRWPEG